MSFLPPLQLVYKLFVGGKILLLVICWTSIKFVVVVCFCGGATVKTICIRGRFPEIIVLKKPCCTCQEPITDLLLNTPTLRLKRGTVFFLSQLIQMTGNQPGVKFVIHCYDSCTIACTSSLFQAFRSWERGRRRKEMCRQKKNCEVV